MRIYEGMFVLDDHRANDNWDGVAAEVRALLERRQAQILQLERWDERRLAYPIEGHNRAVYLLTRFTAPRDAITALERDCQLNETILRVLFTRDIHSEKLHKAGLLQAGPAPEEAEPDEAAAEGPEQPPGPEQAPGPEQPRPQESRGDPAQQQAPNEKPESTGS